MKEAGPSALFGAADGVGISRSSTCLPHT